MFMNKLNLTGFSLFFGALVLMFSLPNEAQAQVDFTLRKAVYLHTGASETISTQSPYAAPNKILTLRKSQAISCDADVCTFNLGVFALRLKGDGKLEPFVGFDNKTTNNYGVGNTIIFGAGEKSKSAIFPFKLKLGKNVVAVAIDRPQKIAETDESNNSFEVSIFLIN